LIKSVVDVMGAYLLVILIANLFGVAIPNHRDLFEMCLLLNMSDEGFKMIDSKMPKFNTFNKGVNLVNIVFTFVVGFTINKDTQEFKENISIWKDITTGSLVLVCSTFFAILMGFFVSLILARVKSIRSTAVSEIMFIIFSTYLISSVAFLDHKWDFVSEEVSVLIFGIFCSHFTRYNMTNQSASRLR